MPIVLASGSPRRKEILQQMGYSFTVNTSNTKESIDGEPEEMVLHLSEEKARAVASQYDNALVLGADTIVAIEDRILGKPHNEKQAAEMMHLLSGKWHSVYTGVCVINTRTKTMVKQAVQTRVHFLPLEEEAIYDYIKTAEPYDKAGGYALQGAAGVFIDKIEGSYSNVIGLPMHVADFLLKKAACS
ncbi:MAG: septum formation inhibitor Maf [Clostridia bacterium]|nr:septum formation inhibitor Maf [Clostridia bacterium]